MFSKYKKGDQGSPDLKSIPGGQPQTRPVSAPAPKSTAVEVKRRNVSRSPAQVQAADKERKRKERLAEIKLELHKELLDNLNLGALENASESDLRAEIVGQVLVPSGICQ